MTSVEPITAELRAYASAVRAYHLTDIHGKKREYVDTTTRELLEIADRIDAEHERSLRDSVEVVRCRDCEHSFFADRLTLCLMNGLPSIREDGYCSRGERREHDYED